ncbi:hypothetical protein AJ87_10360 [Rhizobium yanglingense]|nr:hypothetical protein AJ87_10360 [Rhizobium yanglingense]
MPTEIGGDEAAERRTGERTDKGGNRQQRHGGNQFAPLGGAQENEPADRRHHRAAHALQEAGEDELDQIGRYCTEDRADDEDADRSRKMRLAPNLPPSSR